ncbi:ABC transporter substrate-binding protein [Actinoplanes sp. NPDC048791]|uniref:ABC transporter substrate-binding protein n=1 Tax=Actinoplanes sp. NPDC048791 TaxID=3154623 RepID=UPI0033E3A3E9
MFARRAVGATAIASVLLVAACTAAAGEAGAPLPTSIPSAPEPGVVRLATQPWIGYAPWHIAESKGLTTRYGLDLEQVNLSTDDQVNAALASGRVDGANVSTHTALNLIAGGVDVKIVMIEDVSREADAVLTGSAITTVAGLKGKKIAYEEGSTSDILLRHVLQQSGLAIDDIVRVPMPAADAGAAFIGGRVDAAVTYEPYISEARSKAPDSRSLVTAASSPGLISDVLVIRREVLTKRPGQVAALIRTWDAAVAEYQARPAPSQDIIATAIGADPATLRSAFAGIDYYGLTENRADLTGKYARETLPEVARVATAAQILPAGVELDGIVTGTFLGTP